MNSRAQFKQIQGGMTDHGRTPWQVLTDHIFDTCRVNCTIIIKPSVVSVRTRDLADFYVAKSAIKNMVGGHQIIRDLQDL